MASDPHPRAGLSPDGIGLSSCVVPGFSIAQVTPFPWEDDHEVNAFVAELSGRLAERGHRVLVLAPSRSPELVRDSRRLIRAARENPEALFAPDGEVRVLGVGELLPFNRRREPSPPVDIGRTIEEALALAPLDFVHVHEPFAPSASSVALRHSRALNVGSFHVPSERVLSTQVARRFVELFFGRLDVRTASFEATRELMEHFFPAPYRMLRPGATVAERGEPEAGPLRIAFAVHEERAALRMFLRALRRLPDDVEWEATIYSPTGAAPTGALRSRVRDRITVVETGEADVLAGADVAVAASLGTAPSPGMLLRVLGAGAVPVASRVRAYEEILERRRPRPALRARRRRGPRRPPRAARARPRPAREAARRRRRRARPAQLGPRDRRGGGHLRGAGGQAAPGGGRRRAARAAAAAAADRRRPAHAHRPLGRLRDARSTCCSPRRASAASARSR